MLSWKRPIYTPAQGWEFCLKYRKAVKTIEKLSYRTCKVLSKEYISANSAELQIYSDLFTVRT